MKYGLPVPPAKTTTPLLEVPDRPQPDVGLGHLGDVDRGLDPGLDAGVFHRITECQGVDDRGEHPHVVGVCAIHPRGCRRKATKDVTAADDDGDLMALGVDRGDLGRQSLHRLGVYAIAEDTIGERLARKLEGYTATHYSTTSPTPTRAKRRTEMFSPILAASISTICPTVPSNLIGLTKIWS